MEPSSRGGKITVSCLTCGTETWRWRCQIKRRNFCSPSCRDAYGLVEITCGWPGCATKLSARTVEHKRLGTLYKVDLVKRGGYFKRPICDYHRERYALFCGSAHWQKSLNSTLSILDGQRQKVGRGVTELQRFIVWERQDGVCATSRCGARFAFTDRARPGHSASGWQLDHVVPVFEGGRSELSNLQALCAPCHDGKSRGEKSRAALNRHTRVSKHYRSTNYEKNGQIAALAREVEGLKKAVVFLFAIVSVRTHQHG